MSKSSGLVLDWMPLEFMGCAKGAMAFSIRRGKVLCRIIILLFGYSYLSIL